MFESIPDGIALATNGNDTVDVYVNHETSTVPFPYNRAADGRRLQRLHQLARQQAARAPEVGGVLSGSYAISSDRELPALLLELPRHRGARASTGRSCFTNEEGIDWVNRTGTAWPATIGAPGAPDRAVVAVDEKTGKVKTISGMGRHNHENSVAIPGYGDPVVLSGDDSFVSNPAQSQLYSYIAGDSDAVWNDEGDLWAFVADGVDDYYDFPIGSTRA